MMFSSKLLSHIVFECFTRVNQRQITLEQKVSNGEATSRSDNETNCIHSSFTFIMNDRQKANV
jgi:hypothetical protein